MGRSPLDKLKKIVYNKDTTKRKEMIKMENRTKVILSYTRYDDKDNKLLLTNGQIRLLNWLFENDVIDGDDWSMRVLENADIWEEV